VQAVRMATRDDAEVRELVRFADSRPTAWRRWSRAQAATSARSSTAAGSTATTRSIEILPGLFRSLRFRIDVEEPFFAADVPAVLW